MATKQEILAPLNEEQRDIVINYKGKIDVSACPGSGKTTCMVAVIQYMLKDGVAPSKILAFTFTRKAAKELKERVFRPIIRSAPSCCVSAPPMRGVRLIFLSMMKMIRKRCSVKSLKNLPKALNA